ncbi:protein yipf [Plakobranchus ocellatus]|uniref:Protein yipf n=1 Tax=Plakobranchus ocellatus TaxID=259542 RepID=A0AAV4AI17_9GAST|nr:protein yipf [Plakobranchus ocellatus]
MASSTTIDVDDFGNDIKEAGMESLNFQEIPHDTPDSPEKGQTTHFTRFPNSAADSDDEADDKEKLIKDEKSGTSSFWTFAYYQQFFDVETAQVGQRIVGSMVPKPGSNYLIHQIRPNPDLYGPFWICTTLVFTTAIAGNLANYFSMAGKAYHWQYDFHKVTFAATAIFSYWWLVPLILWGVLWWRGSQAKFSFLEMLCVYGYSLAIYVPISILWAIQVPWLQWSLVMVGAALSGSVLLLTFWPAIKEDSQKIAIGLMVFIFIMHAALAAGFVLYFFYVPTSATQASTVAPSPAPVPVNKTVQAAPSFPKSPAIENGNLNSGRDRNSISSNQPGPGQLQQKSGSGTSEAVVKPLSKTSSTGSNGGGGTGSNMAQVPAQGEAVPQQPTNAVSGQRGVGVPVVQGNQSNLGKNAPAEGQPPASSVGQGQQGVERVQPQSSLPLGQGSKRSLMPGPALENQRVPLKPQRALSGGGRGHG